MSASAEWELMPPRHTFQPWLSPKSKQQDSAGRESAALEWGISMEPLPPRMTAKRLMRHKVEQPISSGPEITAVEGATSMELQPPIHHSQLLMKPIAEQEISAGPESSAAKRSISMEPPPMRHPFQPCLSPKLKQKVSSFPENTAVKERDSMVPLLSEGFAQPLINPKVEQNVFSGSEGAETAFSVEPLLPQCFPQSVTNVQAQHSFSENVAGNEGIFVQMLPPKYLCQPLARLKFQPRSDTSKSASASTEWSSPMEPVPSRHTFHPWESLRFEQHASSDPESTAVEWGIPMEPLPPRRPSRRPKRSVVKQELFSGSVSAPAEWSGPMKPMPPRHAFQPLMSPASSGRAVQQASGQQASASSGRAVAEKGSPMEWMPPRHVFQPLVNLKSEKQASSSSERAVAERSSPMEWMPPRHVFQPLVSPKSEQQASASSGRAVAEKGSPMEWMPPRNASQPWVSHKSEWQASASSKRAVVERSSPMEWMPPRRVFKPLVSPKSEQQASASSERAVAESSPMERMPPRMPSKSPVRQVVKQEVFSGSMSVPAEWSGPMEPMPPRKPSQPQMKPVVKQSISAGPKNVAIEGDTSADLPPPRNWSIVRHKVQQMSSFESAAVEGGIYERSSKYPTHLLRRSKVQEISSYLEKNAVEGGTPKKLPLPRRPSQSFVKFMAQQIFSETPATEERIYVDPLSSNQPSKSLLSPKVEHQVFSDWERADIEGGISLKPLPTKCPLQSLGRPEDPQEVFSHSESPPVKWISSQEQLPPRYLSQKLGKLENQQKVLSVSKSSPKEWWSQAEDEAEFQPHIFSTDSASVPVGQISAKDDHLPPRHPFQAFPDPEYQQQVYSRSMNAPAKGNVFESNSSSWSLLRGPASPNKTRKHGQDSENFIKNIPTPATKPVKFTTSPAWPTSTSGENKKEVLEDSDRDNSYSNLFPSGADVENRFGVRLRRIPSSQKQESEKQDHFTKLPSFSLSPVSSYVGREPQIRSASQGLLGIRENVTTISDFAEKQQNKTRSGSMAKKQSAYKIPGEAPIQQSDYATSEPAWITMVKQRQRNFPTHIPMKEPKPNNRAETKAETKKPTYEGAENQHRKIFTSNVNRQEKMAQMDLPKSTKAERKICQVPSTRKEIRQSSTLPTVLQEPFEPVWFSLAKKKAKAWSHIADFM
ncbi:hypothetical protein PAL_GLEAN10003562 [Pteropus alecto]|uniref:Uncharacterized protein n=1 Tax=Pteropus alecto TaxID=9402 RepID=L5L5I0_PTEAL|nr:hypothetical protein PAL_GLEAN10003562 [Pteropus alecto]